MRTVYPPPAIFKRKMNLFLLHRKHGKNVRRHCNRHAVKMVLETAQLLWAAAHAGGAPVDSVGVTPTSSLTNGTRLLYGFAKRSRTGNTQ